MRTLLNCFLVNFLLASVAAGADLEDRIVRVLTPEQAQALADGLAAEDIDLPNGETLAEYLARQERKSRAGLVLRTLEPCVILDTSQSVEKPLPGYPFELLLRGESSDLSSLGGSAEGCGVPGLAGETFRSNRARALLLSIEVWDAVEAGSLAFESTGDLVTFRPGELTTNSSLIVPLCDEESVEPCAEGDLQLVLERQAEVAITVHGYLEPMRIPRDGEPEQTDTEEASKALTAPFWEKRTDSDDIYYNEGGVGIRTDTPQATLHVRGADAGAIISQPSLINGVSNYFVPDYPTLKLFRGSNSRGALLSIGNQDGGFYLYGSDSTFRIYDPGQTTRLLLNSNGFLGIGTGDPEKTLHVDGSFMLRDPADLGILLRTLQKSTAGYGGGNIHDTQVLTLNTPYEAGDGTRSRSGIVLGSPEIWGGESAYLYGFGTKNIRLGAINDSYRRAEIEIFNNNTSQGKIFFRTGAWQDPANVPGNDTNVRMLIDHSGNVGVGTTAPDEKLDVDGNIKLSGSLVSDGDICIGQCG